MLRISDSVTVNYGECSSSTAYNYWKSDKLHLGIHQLLRFQEPTTFEVENDKLHVCQLEILKNYILQSVFRNRRFGDQTNQGSGLELN
jgi:hypothetical protein